MVDNQIYRQQNRFKNIDRQIYMQIDRVIDKHSRVKPWSWSVRQKDRQIDIHKDREIDIPETQLSVVMICETARRGTHVDFEHCRPENNTTLERLERQKEEFSQTDRYLDRRIDRQVDTQVETDRLSSSEGMSDG